MAYLVGGNRISPFELPYGPAITGSRLLAATRISRELRLHERLHFGGVTQRQSLVTDRDSLLRDRGFAADNTGNAVGSSCTATYGSGLDGLDPGSGQGPMGG